VDEVRNLYSNPQPGGASVFLRKARDVAVGGDNSVWILGDDKRPGGYGIYQRTGSGWTDTGGAAVRIAVDKSGRPWVVNEAGDIFMYNTASRSWELKPGKASSVHTGAHSGAVWMLGVEPIPGGFPISQWDPAKQNWDTYGSLGAVEMTEAAGTPWIVQGDGSIYSKLPDIVITQLTGPIDITITPSLPPMMPQLQPPIRISGSETGKLLCSRTGLASCGKTKADFVGEYGLDLSCDSGFYDPIWGGTCWKCPDDTDNKGSWIRSATAVDKDDACWRIPKESTGKATKVKAPALAWDCPSGSFWDGYSPDGCCGSCWKCPDDLPRRTGNAVWSDAACATSLNETRPATLLTFNGCPTPNAATMDLPGKRSPGRPFLDIAAGWHQGLLNGGCYACPIADETGNFLITERNADAIYDKDGNTGCTIGLKWQPPPFFDPGLAYMQGVKEVIWEQRLLDVDKISGFLYDMAEARELGDATPAAKDWVAKRWQEIAKGPYNSEQFRAYIFAYLKTALKKCANDRTPAEQKLIQSFATYIRDRRIYLAEQGLAMYDAWKAHDDAYRQQTSQTRSLSQLFYYGTVPLDFHGTLSGLTGVGGFGGGVLGSLFAAYRFGQGVDWVPTAKGILAPDRSKMLFGLGNGLKILKSAQGLTAVAGATVIQVAFAILSSIAIDQFVAIQSARPRLEASLTVAKEPLDLNTLAKSDNGEDMLYFFWAKAVDTTDPEDPQVVQMAAEAQARAQQAGYPAPPKGAVIPVSEVCTGDRLSSGASSSDLVQDQKLVSNNGKFEAVMQSDGNFVIYQYTTSRQPIWATGTNGRGVPPYRLAVQADSNLVVYGASGPTWASGIRGGTAPFTLIMQDDGNLVVYDNSQRAVWASGTQR
jgi:hypothetical protein